MKTLKLFIVLVCLVSITSCNKEKTPLPQGAVADDWLTFSRDDTKEFQIFSKVSSDSSSYIANIQILYHGEELRDHPEYCRLQGNWLVHYTLDRIQDCGYIYYNSLGNIVYNDTHTKNDRNWSCVHSGTRAATVAKYAKLLYDDEHHLGRYSQPIDVDWGSGEWYKYNSNENDDMYFTVVEESESSYFVWVYAHFRKMRSLSFATADDENIGIQRLIYGLLYKFEVQKNAEKMKDLNLYFVDKYGDVFYDASSYGCSNEWSEADLLQPAVVEYVKNNKPRLRKRR